MNIFDVKQNLINHLAQMDLNKLSMLDLSAYTQIVGQIAAMERPDPMAEVARLAAGFVVPQKIDEKMKVEEVS